jgi:DNA-binding beta-propeller fold protein YncE
MRIHVGIIFGATLLASQAMPLFADGGTNFAVDPSWPKPLPHNWILGQIGGIATDAQDHIWVLQRPTTLTDDERGAALTPPVSKCCFPAPPVLEFDIEGNLLRHWGGPGSGYDWPLGEHGISVDADKNVWIAGNGKTDHQVLKFTADGKFLLQIGHADQSGDSNSTDKLGRPALPLIDGTSGELYVADGYKNHRIIVFDGASGQYKRHWGAYGSTPKDESATPYDPDATIAEQFRNPVHCVRFARDELVYVCDRLNDRVQVFRKSGKFVTEFIIEPRTRGAGSVWDIALSIDAEQKYLYVADGTNNCIYVLIRATGQRISEFGAPGRMAGQFHWLHTMAIDSKGNIYTGEVDTGKRVQKFRPTDN